MEKGPGPRADEAYRRAIEQQRYIHIQTGTPTEVVPLRAVTAEEARATGEQTLRVCPPETEAS